MASISSFHITRQNPLFSLPPLDLHYNSSLPSEIDPSLVKKIDQFFLQQQHTLECIDNTSQLNTFEELRVPVDRPWQKYADIKALMQSTHTIPLRKEEIFNLLEISSFLKTLSGIKEYVEIAPQRFKIEGFCSITLFQGKIFIHLKKSKTKCPLAEGTSIKVTRAIHVAQEEVSLVTELTYKGNRAEKKAKETRETASFREKVAALSQEKDLLICPMVSYSYIGHMEKQKIIKYCKVFPHYTADFFSILFYDQLKYKRVLTLETKWKMFCFVAKKLQSIHHVGLVYRDLKEENSLISFSITPDNKIDFNTGRFALCDFELLKEEDDSESWEGTKECWPPSKANFKELQKKPADIYALSVFFKELLESAIPHSLCIQSRRFRSIMMHDDPSQRATIDTVVAEAKKYLLENHPGFTWAQELT